MKKIVISAATLILLAGCATNNIANIPTSSLERIQNVVVIYAENHSFDNLYGLFPNANNISRATEAQKTQLDHDGTPLKELIVFGDDGKPDPRFPRLPNAPFRIDAPPVNRSPSTVVMSPTHLFYHNQEQINGGQNNQFVAMSSVGGWVMGHYDGSQFKLWQWAKEYTLADNFFMGAFGGSYLNHQYLICACVPQYAEAPASMRAVLDANGKLAKKPDSPSAAVGAVQVVNSGAQVTPDGYSVNTSQPPYQPSAVPPALGGDPAFANPEKYPTPPQTNTTIGDTLSAKGVSWTWFAGGFNQALVDGMQPPEAPRKIIYNPSKDSPNFQTHHLPFNYFKRFAPYTPDRALHIRDGDEFMQAIDKGTLPTVSFYKPAGVNTQHPGYADITTGDEHIHGILEKLKASPQWKNMLVIVAYDENGGFWDHVPPPTGAGVSDRFGPGTRIPVIVIGPHVKKGYIDSTLMDTGSILQFLTRRFGLQPLSGVRPKMGDLTSALEN